MLTPHYDSFTARALDVSLDLRAVEATPDRVLVGFESERVAHGRRRALRTSHRYL